MNSAARFIVSRPPPDAELAPWSVAQDRPYALVATALQALRRDHLTLLESALDARILAEQVARGELAGAVVFCIEPALVCCIANKVKGVRAAAVSTVAEAGRLRATLVPQVVAVEMPGRTFFEVRQILRTFCQSKPGECPSDLARTLEELEGHAHR